MVARLQQSLVALSLAVAVAWCVFWLPSRWGVAAAGVVAIITVHALVIALECALAAWVGRDDPMAPRPRLVQVARAWLAESFWALVVFAWRQPFRSLRWPDRCVPSAGRRGVLFIHGYLCNRGFWNDWMRAVQELDRNCIAINLEPIGASIDCYAPVIDAAVARLHGASGVPPLVICHSMGGLAARAWLATTDPRRVHRVVTLGSPHRGTWLARFGYTQNGREMRSDGPFIRRMHETHATRAASRFVCFYSNCDNIVFPPTCATLPGADNRLVVGRAHVELAFDSRVRDEALAFLSE